MTKKRAGLLLVCFSLLVFLSACGTGGNGKKGDAEFVVATVNGVEIKQSFIDKTFGTWLFMKRQSGELASDGKQKDEDRKMEELFHYGRRESAIIKTNILDLKIKGILIEEYYKKKQKSISEEELNQKYEEMMKLMGEKMPNVLDFYKENEIEEDFIKDGIKTNYYLGMFSEDLDAAYRESYELDPAAYKNTKLTVNPRIILLDDRETADKVYAKLQEGTKFEELVAEYSLDESSKVRDGEVGTVRLDELPVEFSIHLKELKRGEISKPFKTVFGYNIVKLIDYKTVEDMLQDKDLTDSEEAATKTQVYNQNFQIKLYEETNRLLEEAKVEIFKDFYKEDSK